jgi:lipoprotein-releasing system permease protein
MFNVSQTGLFASFFIGMRYAKIMRQRKLSRSTSKFLAFINFFSVLGLTLGVMSLIVVMAVMSGLEGQLKDRMLNLIPHVLIQSDEAVNLPTSLLRSQTLYTESQALLQTQQGLAPIVVQGMATQVLLNELALNKYLVLGEFSDFVSDYHIVLGSALARQLNVSVGDKVRIIVPGQSRYTPFGRIPLQRLVTVQAIYQMLTNADDYMVFMPLSSVQKFTRGSPKTQRLFLSDAFALGEIFSYLEGTQFSTWREREGAFFDAVRMEKNLMSIMLSLIVAIAAFNIVAALVMLVNEKHSDIAILRTQGFSKPAVMLIFIITGLTNAIKGTLLGCLLGIVVIFSMNPLLLYMDAPISLAIDGNPIPYILHVSDVAKVILGAIGLCLMATILPSLRALKVEPSQALASE